MSRKNNWILPAFIGLPFLTAVIFLYGCQSFASIQITPTTTPVQPGQPTFSPNMKPTATRVPTLDPPRAEATSTESLLITGSTPTEIITSIGICSPLKGVSIQAINTPDLLKNPFAPPRPGYDDGHFGIDLAYWTDSEGQPMLGLPVYAALGGTVAGVIENRQPYGYAVIIETPIDRFPSQTLHSLDLPIPNHNLQPALGISCPDYNFNFEGNKTSIYTIYAHLDQLPLVKTGNQVVCGQSIGVVGTTGRSVNPHLHLEMRHGPAGMTFASMAHYDNAATQEEIRLYCLWRISGGFAPFDPLHLFKLTQQDR